VGRHARRSIFEKIRLTPGAMRTVADRRFDDAEALRKTGENARANGAMYLAGFVVECLLKARLLKEHPWLQRSLDPGSLSAKDKQLYLLCYKMHDLEQLLEHLPDLKRKVLEASKFCPSGSNPFQSLMAIVEDWTIFARYSPRTATIDEAARFLKQVKEVKKWLN